MKYIITTPLYYVNDKPHLGSVYTTIICDSIARFKRLLGEEVIFITGVDEHGLKIQRKAKDNQLTAKEHCDQISEIFYNTWIKWDISFDKFIRTSTKHHENFVKEFYEKVKKSDDIYMGMQKGWYCVGCEEFKDNPDNSPNTICPIHNKNLEWRNEENLFFKLSKYQKEIENLISNPSFIEPKERRNEIINFVSKGLKDFSISRTNIDWGIPVPNVKEHTFYVWFDALLGYVSALSLDKDNLTIEEISNNLWPANLHLIGKDILRFHAIYWPAMLISAGMKPPKKVFGHGFLTREGQKMGKSLGNVLDPELLIKRYGIDPVRWYLLKDISIGNDGDFQHRRFIDIVNNDLANTIGNLLNRTISMSRKWFENKVPTFDESILDNEISTYAEEAIDKYIKYFEQYKIDQAASEILNYANKINLYLNNQAPWILIKDKSNELIVKNIIYNVLESTRIIGLLLIPILPNLASNIDSQLGNNYCSEKRWEEQLKWGLLTKGNTLPAPQPIITKLEYE